MIRLPEQFDFMTHQAFRSPHKDTQQPGMRYVIDFQLTCYMDSSALGMLLLMHEKLSGNDAEVRFINCSPWIKSLLKIVNFHKIFTFYYRVTRYDI